MSRRISALATISASADAGVELGVRPTLDLFPALRVETDHTASVPLVLLLA